MTLAEKIAEKSKMYFNQNLIFLLISLTALGLSEKFALDVTFWFAFVISILSTISVSVTMLAYTIHYWRRKVNKNKT